MINGLHHTSLVTQDLERLRHYYRDVIGFEEVVEFNWDQGAPPIDRMLQLRDTAGDLVILRAGNTYLELTHFRNPVGRSMPPVRPVNDVGYGHFCLDVVNFDAEFARLSEAGVEFNAPGLTTPPDVDQPGCRVKTAYAHDPDGNSFEFQELLDPHSPMAISHGKEGSNIRGLHHTTIVTRNREELRRFYCDVVGFQEVVTFSWDAGFEEIDEMVQLEGTAVTEHLLKAGTMYLEICEYRSPLGRVRDGRRPVNDCGIAHICLDVTDFDAEYERLKEAGVEFNAPGLTSPPEITAEEFMVKTTYGRDPDGNSFEFQEVMDSRSPMALPSLVEA